MNEHGRFVRAVTHPAFLVWFATLALALFTLPQVQSPPIGAYAAYGLIYGTWSLLVVVLALVAWSRHRKADDRKGRDGHG